MITLESTPVEVIDSFKDFKIIPYKKYPLLVEWLDHHMSFLGDVKTATKMFCLKAGLMSYTDFPDCANPSCSNKVAFLQNGYSLSSACSKKCMALARAKVYEQNMLAKHGVTNASKLDWVKEKVVKNTMEKYGVSNVIMAKEVQEKRTNTLIARHGTSNSFGTEAGKVATTFAFEKYGGNPMLSKEVLAKRNTSLLKPSKENPDKTIGEMSAINGGISMRRNRIAAEPSRIGLECRDWLYDQYINNEMSLRVIGEMTKTSTQTVCNRLEEFGITARTSIMRSSYEVELCEFLDTLGVDYSPNHRGLIGRKELDIYVESHKFAIEFHGLYWHTSRVLPKTYHKNKQDACENAGIRLLQIFEDEWLYHKDIVKNRIRHLLGLSDKARVYARKTVTSEISLKEAKPLYEANHIQGATGATKHYGLYHNDELVACMSFQDKRDGVWELVRYATGCNVVGGFSKLLKHFIRTHNPSKVTSFADRRWSTGDVYEVNGFENVGLVPINYQYVVGDVRVRKENFRRERIEKKFMDGELEFFDPAMSEREIMEMNNIYQIYDAGLIRYELVI